MSNKMARRARRAKAHRLHGRLIQPKVPLWTTHCRFCKRPNTDHAARGKCLYEPTYFQSMSIPEYLAYENARWAPFDKEFWLG